VSLGDREEEREYIPFDLHLLGIGVVLWEIKIVEHGSRRVKTDNVEEMLWAKERTHRAILSVERRRCAE